VRRTNIGNGVGSLKTPKESLFENLEALIKPFEGRTEYLIPMIIPDRTADYDVFLLGINPATTFSEEDCSPGRFAELLLDEQKFNEFYSRKRLLGKSQPVSKTKTGLLHFMKEVERETGVRLLRTNIIPFPAPNIRALKQVGPDIIAHSTQVFLEVLLTYEPRLLIVYSKYSLNKLMELLDGQGMLIRNDGLGKTIRELERTGASFSFRYSNGKIGRIFPCRHFMYYGKEGRSFAPFRKRVIDHLQTTGGVDMEIRENGKSWPVLDRRTMPAIFDCVYGLENPSRKETKALLRDSKFHAFVSMLNGVQEYNYRYRQSEVSRLFPMFDRAFGPFEINSDGAVLWLALGLALQELYGLRDETLEHLLAMIEVRK